ncbi:MAG: host attachment protein [Burkholderiaceae bacterium]
MKNWLVVANASKARVLEESNKPDAYVHLADLVHPQSRQKGMDLDDDRPGHVNALGPRPGGSTYDSRTNPREREHDRFAREVATAVNDGVAAGQCAGLVLVASNPFLGHVKAHLSEQAHKVLLRCVASDYTALRDAEIARRLAKPESSELS